MNLEKLEKLAELVLKDLKVGPISTNSIYSYEGSKVKFKNLIINAYKILPEHKHVFEGPIKSCEVIFGLTIGNAISITNHLLEIIQLEKTFQNSFDGLKIFDSAQEKIKQGSLSFKTGDFHSVFSCLNTSFELLLKDKIGIPTTITGINTTNVVEVLIKHKIEPFLYFKEVQKRVTQIDNKIKHQGYSPLKIDAINGIKAMEDLNSKLKDKEIKLTDEAKNKICEGL